MKIILATQRVDEVVSYKERRDALDQQWITFLKQCGYVICPLPNHSEVLVELMKNIKHYGILLTGGNTPVGYGGNAPERDAMDKELIKYSIENGIPLLGVCRGMQSIVQYFGGTLKKVEGHVAVRHYVNGEVNREVNSYHGFAVDKLPECLRVCARSNDTTIEMVRHEKYPILGMMWHPERENPFSDEDVKLVNKLFLEGTI